MSQGDSEQPPTPGQSQPKASGGGMFRAKALEKVSDPSDQLDQLMRVTSPRAWLALIALFVVVIAAIGYGFLGSAPTIVAGQGIFLPPGGLVRVQAPEPGTIAELHADNGPEVETGDALVTLRTVDGTTMTVESPVGGHLVEQLIDVGNVVDRGTRLYLIEPHGDEATVVAYVPAGAGKSVQPGMDALLSPTTAPSEEYGQIRGTVEAISEVPVSSQRLDFIINNEFLEERLNTLGPLLEVTILVHTDDATPSGFAWTSGDGPPFEIGHGTLASIEVVLDEEAPAGRLFGNGR